MNWEKLINVPSIDSPIPAYIPKWWVDKNNLKPGKNRLRMTVNDDGDLVISPMPENDMTPNQPESEITSSSCNGDNPKNPDLRAR
jgi:hypothetical protein